MSASDVSTNLGAGADAAPAARADLTNIGGYVGITCGVSAWYVAFAHVTNAAFGRELIPT